MSEISNQPLSEQYRVIAKKWVDADNAARLLEETKSAVLSERMAALGDVPVSHAERDVKASDEWKEFIAKMVSTRSEANRLKLHLEYIRMRHSEQQSFEASKRAEMRL